MEKNTILAVVLSIVVITGFYLVQYTFFPPQPQTQAQTAPQNPQADTAVTAPVIETQAPQTRAADVSAEAAVADAGPAAEERVVVETGLYTAVLTNAGGDLASFRLNEHKDGEDNVDMIFSGSGGHAFTIAFGGREAAPVTSLFYVNRVSDTIIEFYRDFTTASGGVFRLSKKYTFIPGEYMFELAIAIDGGYSVQNLNFGGAAYTLGFGPQIGPKFEKLDERYDYRHYLSFIGGKLKREKVTDTAPAVITSRLSWAAIAGKYFTFIAIPDSTMYTFTFATRPAEEGLASASRFYMTRPPVAGSRAGDTFRFYLGPKDSRTLATYDKGTNAFGYNGMELEKAANTSGFWSILNPLERLLKWMLMLFYNVVHNYGVAIILVTLIVKLVLFPLTKKGSEGTLRMQQMAPKIKELQNKHKDNPQKMNAEMAELYKKEGYNPLSGCLPMLLQLPIFFAMYNLFNNHFDLRGAMFIPGWIPDLSLPETIFNFAPARIPILGWSDIRLLPFVYVGSQLLYSKVTQTPDQQGNAQMKMMMYMMPIMFFFILYNVPSGLLVYWIMSNVLTMAQQLALNKYIAKKKAALAATAAPVKNVIAPPPKRKKRR
jgi:YidC/Oxa1 family membrane protein insertase